MKFYELKCIHCGEVKHASKFTTNVSLRMCKECFNKGCSYCGKSFIGKVYIYKGKQACNSCYRGTKKKSVVYLLVNENYTLFKVGHTNDLHRRIKMINNYECVNENLTLLSYHEMPESSSKRKLRGALESILHLKFRKYKSHGEDYFTYIDKALFNYICNDFLKLVNSSFISQNSM